MLDGIEAIPIQVEASITKGIPETKIIGNIPIEDAQATATRVKFSIVEAGFKFPDDKKIIVNLGPTSIKKDGPGFDLAIAVAILVETQQIPANNIENYIFIGELSLYGHVRESHGILAFEKLARTQNKTLVCAESTPYPSNKSKKIEYLKELRASVVTLPNFEKEPIQDTTEIPDFKDILGYEQVKRAITISIAGHHPILFISSDMGMTKSIAYRIPSIMPKLAPKDEELVKIIRSIAHKDTNDIKSMGNIFRNPNYNMLERELIYSDDPLLPGEVTFAHKGILYLEEIERFETSKLEKIKKIYENKEVTITSTTKTYHFPADFMLIASAKPCPCGHYGDTQHYCSCIPQILKAYQERLAKPLRNTFEMSVNIPAHSNETKRSATSTDMALDIIRAKQFAEARNRKNENNEYLSESARNVLASYSRRLKLTQIQQDNVLLIARTIADIELRKNIMSSHIIEALNYRPY